MLRTWLLAYTVAGAWKGTVLTVWRLLRCNPWASFGYDPPRWPPVGLEAVYQYPYTPEVSVLAGAWLFYYLISTAF